MTTTDHATARSTTSAYTRSRAAAVSSLESASSGTRPRRPAGRTQAAGTSGPAHAPRPASSAPAIAEKPRRRNLRSISHRASASGTGSGEAERAGAERRAIAVRPYDAPTTERRRDTLPANAPRAGSPREGEPARGVRTAEEADGPAPKEGSGVGVSRDGALRQAVRAAGAHPAAVAGGEHERDSVRPVAGT